jgi:hypothetical protein
LTMLRPNPIPTEVYTHILHCYNTKQTHDMYVVPTRLQHFRVQHNNREVVGNLTRDSITGPFVDDAGFVWVSTTTLCSLFHNCTVLRSRDGMSSSETIIPQIPGETLFVSTTGLTRWPGNFNIFHPTSYPFRHLMADVVPSLLYGTRGTVSDTGKETETKTGFHRSGVCFF